MGTCSGTFANRRRLAVVLAALAVVATGCDSPETAPPDPPPSDTDVVVLATDSFEYQPSTIQVESGPTSIALQCEQSLAHDLVVETDTEDVIIVECGGGTTAVGELDLPQGSYTFFCSIPGHRSAGMEGQLTVG